MATPERLIQRCVRFGTELNVFRTDATDERSLKLQRWSTRLYILLLCVAILILFIYTTARVTSRQYEVKKPSLSIYLKLAEKYGAIRCPCTEISVNYETFVELLPRYHQICSSDLISSEWIAFLFDRNKTSTRFAIDFRATASHQFQLLSELCRLSRDTVDDGLKSFYRGDLISSELFTVELFQTQLEADTAAFQTVTTARFRRSLLLTRSILVGNLMIPASQTSYSFTFDWSDSVPTDYGFVLSNDEEDLF